MITGTLKWDYTGTCTVDIYVIQRYWWMHCYGCICDKTVILHMHLIAGTNFIKLSPGPQFHQLYFIVIFILCIKHITWYKYHDIHAKHTLLIKTRLVCETQIPMVSAIFCVWLILSCFSLPQNFCIFICKLLRESKTQYFNSHWDLIEKHIHSWSLWMS